MHVPGWHAAVGEQGLEKHLRTVGILQEQHPDRARLFMQWKRMDWPLLVDSLNLLGVEHVPITLLIDEEGIIRAIDPPLDDPSGLKRFARDGAAGGGRDGPRRARGDSSKAPDLAALGKRARGGGAADWRRYADALYLWGGDERLDEAIGAYGRSLALEPSDAAARFRMGVAHRRRFDADGKDPGDFRAAVEAWFAALEIDPNNYIWRRRIQQYGPRLDKPYAFYDWVTTAREEIVARGETPLPLAVEPGGAEFAAPADRFDSGTRKSEEPDPDGRIRRDPGRFIGIRTVVVPPAVPPGGAARVHVTFTPNDAIKAHWNNEVRDLALWVVPSEGWRADAKRHTVPNPDAPVSREVRRIEFEVRAPAGADPGPARIPAYALYYVCEDVKGTCLYRRQDVTVRVDVKPSS